MVKDAVTAAYINVIRTSKQVQALQSTMSPVVLKEMALGLDEKNNMFEGSDPSFFTGRIGLAYKAEKRKLEKVSVEPVLGNIQYDFHFSAIPNEKDQVTGLYYPDLLGRKMHTKVTKHETYLFRCGVDDEKKNAYHTTDMSDIVDADITNEHTHKFLSLICKKKKAIERQLTDLIPDELTADRANMIDMIIELASPRSHFRHETVSFHEIPTADYVIHICGTKHHYNSPSNTFGIEIDKKIVFATVKGDKDQHIPVCEELVILLKIPDTSSVKGMPTLVNFNQCFVISCSIGTKIGPHQAVYNVAHLHYFAENAFTIGFKTTTKSIPQDKTKICARLVGTVIKHMNNINSTEIANVASSVGFFKEMFNFNNYATDATDTDTYGDKMKTMMTFSEKAPDLFESKVNTIAGMIGRSKEPDRQSSENESIKMTLNSFLKRQNIRSLMEVNAGKGCNVVKWISSQSFSILALSPNGMPHINYVFILTYSNKTLKSPDNQYQVPKRKVAAAADFSQAPTEQTSAISDRISLRSMLSPDLEEELSVLFK